MSDVQHLQLHASCVDIDGAGLLIKGASGTGKSSLALQMMALGAQLVADDRTDVTRHHYDLVATCPPTIQNRIEARGIGILHAKATASCQITAIVDLDVCETERLPPARWTTLLSCTVPLLHKVDSPAFPAALLQYLRYGRETP